MIARDDAPTDISGAYNAYNGEADAHQYTVLIVATKEGWCSEWHTTHNRLRCNDERWYSVIHAHNGKYVEHGRRCGSTASCVILWHLDQGCLVSSDGTWNLRKN
jgi:hypothetical protein